MYTALEFTSTLKLFKVMWRSIGGAPQRLTESRHDCDDSDDATSDPSTFVAVFNTNMVYSFKPSEIKFEFVHATVLHIWCQLITVWLAKHLHTWRQRITVSPTPHLHTWRQLITVWPTSHFHTWRQLITVWPTLHLHTWRQLTTGRARHTRRWL